MATSGGTKKPPFLLIIIALLGAAACAWMAFRPLPRADDYQTVSGTVAASTAVGSKGATEFTVRVWLEGQPGTAYKTAAKVPGETLGKIPMGPGSNVEMQALKSEIAKPFTGVFHNVAPTIEIASLTVNGAPMSTWQDHFSYARSQKKIAAGVMVGVLILAGVLMFERTRKRAG
jgi:hypothetical protein